MLFGKKDRTNSRINTNKGIREERSVPAFSAILIAFANTIKKPADRIRMSAGAIRKTTSLRGVCKAVFVLRTYALRGKYLEFEFAIVGDRLAINRQYIQVKATIVEDVECVFEEIFCSTH